MEFLKLIIKKIYQHIHNVVITVELLNMGLVVVSLLLLLLLLINSKFILSFFVSEYKYNSTIY